MAKPQNTICSYQRFIRKLPRQIDSSEVEVVFDSISARKRAGGMLPSASSKTPVMESKDSLKRRIEAAAKYVPLGDLCIGPQCGFASHEKGLTS